MTWCRRESWKDGTPLEPSAWREHGVLELSQAHPMQCNHTPVLMRGRRGGERKQVNKALHTCTSWYAYAAMFGSSTDMMVPRANQLMYR